MDKELLNEIDKVLNDCRKHGLLPLTKTTFRLTKTAIQESVSRGWLINSSPHIYKLSPIGIEVLDFGTVEEYLLDKKAKRNSISTPTTVINAKNLVYGDTSGDINQSSKSQTNNLTSNTTMYNTAQTKRKISAIEWVAIVVGAIASIIAIYEFLF